MLARRSNWARRPAGRISPRAGPSRRPETQGGATCGEGKRSKVPEARALPLTGVKRQQESDAEENVEPKTRRLTSPQPMEEDTPPRPQQEEDSDTYSDLPEPVALLPETPPRGAEDVDRVEPRERELNQDRQVDPWVEGPLGGINQGTRVAELAQRLPDVAYRTVRQSGPTHYDFVHMIMPLDDMRVPTSLRSGFRPLHPYPFTGNIGLRDRPEVRRRLEADWNEEAARLVNPTVVQVASMLQLRTLWRWEMGWRRSRRTGQWLFLGDRNSYGFVARMAAEEEEQGPRRQRAVERMAAVERQEAADCPLIAVEAQRRMTVRLHRARREGEEEDLRAVGLDPRDFPGNGEVEERRQPDGGDQRNRDGRREDDAERIQLQQEQVELARAQQQMAAWIAAGVAQAQGGGQQGPPQRPRHPNPFGNPWGPGPVFGGEQAAAPRGARHPGGAQPGRGGPRGLGLGPYPNPFPNPWGPVRGAGERRGGHGRRERRGGARELGRQAFNPAVPADPWLGLMAQMANNPVIHAWRHRVRVMEYLLMDIHPTTTSGGSWTARRGEQGTQQEPW